MRKAVLFALLLYSTDSTFAVTHSLHYVYTGTSGISSFPEFTVVGTVDEEPFIYYDSITREAVPRQDWIAKSVGPDYWKRESDTERGAEPVFKANIETAKQRFNQTGGIHTAQGLYGCEWDDETGMTSGYHREGYDGEDFIVFDMQNMRWIAPVPQAFPTKQKWDGNKAKNEQRKNYLTQICTDWLKKYVDYGRSSLQRTDPPQVFVLQKDPSSPVTCHATGFFPKGIMVTWKKDGEDMFSDVEVGETVPNGDGTFQTSSQLSVKPEDWRSHRYTCVVQHKSSPEDVVVRLSEENVKRNNKGGVPLTIIIISVALVLAVAAVVIGVVVWKRSRTASDSDVSGQQAPNA